jgi:pectate lyase
MKTKSSLIIGVCIATLVLCAPVTAPAKAKAATSPAPSAAPAASASPMAKTATGKANRSIPFRGKIASVDAKAKTFTIAGKETSRVVKITDQTTITKQGAAATMKDIVADEEVRGSYWKKEDGSLEARNVKLGPPTAEEMAKRDARRQGKAGAATEASPSPAP